MAIAYGNKHFKELNEKMKTKRADIARQMALEPRFGQILYHPKAAKDGLMFYDEADALDALKAGWTTGLKENDPETAKMLADLAKDEKEKKPAKKKG